MSRVISLEEVSQHQNTKSLWVVIHNDVYDITEFIPEHPGGEEVLVEESGKDATEAFEDIGHSNEARAIMAKYKIGTLREEDKKSNTNYNKLRAGELPKEQSSSVFRYLIPAIAVAGVLVYKLVLLPRRH